MITESAEMQAWALLQAARELADAYANDGADQTRTLSDDGSAAVGFYYKITSRHAETVVGEISDADLIYTAEHAWRYSDRLPEDVRHYLDLYLPVLGTRAHPSVVIGHLGQSIDARIATASGDAFFVTGEENRKHLHRLRALCQAVVIGAGTAVADDPQLTVRAVESRNAIRVIIDPHARVPASLGLLVDGQAPTWLIHGDDVVLDGLPDLPGCRRFSIPWQDGALQPRDILSVLAAHGAHRVFVEGGGVSVSHFFNADCLSRLHVAAAPVLVGEGVPALQLPGVPAMKDARRPPCRLYRMGHDVLWDFALDACGLRTGSVQSPCPVAEGYGRSSLQRLL